MRFVTRLSAAISLIIGLSWGSGADAGALPEPQNPPILTLTGAIANTNIDRGATFDDAMLASLPRRTMKVAALNDYVADVPFADALTYDVILADRIDGAPIPVRERGPLFIIYPFDQVPSLRNEQYYERSVWQVKSIEVQQ
jgi:hypothetical protein